MRYCEIKIVHPDLYGAPCIIGKGILYSRFHQLMYPESCLTKIALLYQSFTQSNIPDIKWTNVTKFVKNLKSQCMQVFSVHEVVGLNLLLSLVFY